MSGNRSKVPGTIYDRKLSDYFENWVVESGVKMKFNTVTYYIEKQVLPKPTGLWDHFLRSICLRVPDTKNIMHVVTNMPGALIGRSGHLIDKYTDIFTNPELVQGIDEVQLHEVKAQENLWKGVKRKTKELELNKK